MSVPLYHIIHYPAAVLAQPAQPVTQFGKPLDQIIKRMVPTMRQAEGVGLAAPQVGRALALAVIEYQPRAHDQRGAPVALRTLVNPIILEYSREVDEYSEGCLSCPGIEVTVRRSTIITVEFHNSASKLIKQTVAGFAARIYQHEIDHLNGQLILDRAQGQRALVEAYRANPSDFAAQASTRMNP